MNGFNLQILEANSIFYDGMCDSLVIPTIDGYYGIMAGHANTILALETGILTFHIPKEDVSKSASVSGGLVKVEDNEVLILTDCAENPDEIDIKRELKQLEEAKELILQEKSIVEHKAASLAIARSLNRLKLKGYDTADPLN